MSLLQKIIGYATGNGVEVDTNNQILVGLPNNYAATGKVRMMSENDDGTLTGNVLLESPESDIDYRLRVAEDCILEDEVFNYAAQNTSKHTIIAAATNLAPSWTTSGFNSNPTNVVTASSGATLQSYAFFSLINTGTLSMDIEASFSAAPTSNTVIDFGLFLSAATNPFAPTDGVYFRLNSSGLLGVVNYNGNETTIGPFPAANGSGTWTYTPNKKYQFILYLTARDAEFWVNAGGAEGAYLLGTIACPSGQGTICMSTSLPAHVRHAIVGGTAGAGLNMITSRYSIRLGGVTQTDSLALYGSRVLGSYQALSGSGSVVGLQGSVFSSGSTTAPTAAVPTNTTNALGNAGLGTYVWETFSLVLATDGILCAYQVPAGTTMVQGRRLKISGISLTSAVQTVLAGGPQNRFFYLAFGGTAISLQTSESGFVKLSRRLRLPFVQTITSNQAINTQIAQNIYDYKFVNPVYVNPGEWIQVVVHAIGTVGTSGTIATVVSMDYSWE